MLLPQKLYFVFWYIVVFHDISELKRLEKVREDFVANVSHELRTPLNAILGFAPVMIRRGELDKEDLESLRAPKDDGPDLRQQRNNPRKLIV